MGGSRDQVEQDLKLRKHLHAAESYLSRFVMLRVGGGVRRDARSTPTRRQESQLSESRFLSPLLRIPTPAANSPSRRRTSETAFMNVSFAVRLRRGSSHARYGVASLVLYKARSGEGGTRPD